MTDLIVDGYTAVWWVPTLTLTAPTAAQITAGTKIDQVLTAGGLEGFEAATATVDTSAFSSVFETGVPGRVTYDGLAIVVKMQSGTDTIFATLSAFGTAGYLVIRDSILATTAPAASQKVDIYPVISGQYSKLPREANSVLRYRVPFGRPASQPVLNVALV